MTVVDESDSSQDDGVTVVDESDSSQDDGVTVVDESDSSQDDGVTVVDRREESTSHSGSDRRTERRSQPRSSGGGGTVVYRGGTRDRRSGRYHGGSTYRGGDTYYREEHHHYYGDDYYHDDYYYDEYYYEESRQQPRTHREHSRTTTGTSTTTRRRASDERSSGSSSVEEYWTLGAGISAMEMNQAPRPTGSGFDANIGIGARGSTGGVEVGLGYGHYEFTDLDDNPRSRMLGTNLDLRLQPSVGSFEPYGLVGVGGHVMNNDLIEADALGSNALWGASFRLGFGADFRFQNDLALRASYLRGWYAFESDGIAGPSPQPTTESLGLSMLFYF